MSRNLLFTGIRVRSTDDLTGDDSIFVQIGEVRVELGSGFEQSERWYYFPESPGYLVEIQPGVLLFSVYESDAVSADDLVGQISIPEGDGEFTQQVSNGDASYEIAFSIFTL